MQKIKKSISHSRGIAPLLILRVAPALVLAIAALTPLPAKSAAGRDPVAEVTKFERQLEHVYSSQEFIDDPHIASPFYDESDKVRMFDAILPLQFKGGEVSQHIVDVGGQFFGKVKFYDMDISADENLAFASMLQHFSGKTKDGTQVDFIMRVTDCLRWSSGHWLIAQEHISVPVDPTTFVTMIKTK